MEKKADRLFAQLETVKGILDRIANSQTDRLVRRTNSQMHRQSGVNDDTCCWPTPVNVTHTRTRQHCVVLDFYFVNAIFFLNISCIFNLLKCAATYIPKRYSLHNARKTC